MKTITLILVLLIFSVSGNTQTTISATIQHNSLTREYRLYIPASYTGNEAVPLLFNLHGYTSSNIEQEAYGDFRPIADTANFIIVHPNGTFDQNNNRFWSAFGTSGIDDVGFISALIDTVSTAYNIDSNCVYSTGMSNGGFMSYKLACELGNRITAIASVTGSMVYTEMSACNPAHPTPIMQIHGTADATVDYNGNFSTAGMDTLVNYWVNYNNCDPTPTITAVPNISTTDNCTAENHLYENGDNNVTVEFYKIDGGGHSWPGAPVNINTTNYDFDASLVIWQFFRKYKLDKVASANYHNEDKFTVQLFPNPTEGNVTISTNSYTGKIEVTVTDILGNLVLKQVSPTNSVQLQLPKKASGVYFVQVNTNGQQETIKLMKK